MSETQFSISYLDDLKSAYPSIKPNAQFKQNFNDFIVIENLSFKPVGTGTHAYLLIEKTNLNTQDVIRSLAHFSGLAEKHIGYAGLKDKLAITQQWFSINLEKISEPNWDEFSIPNIQIITQTYHPKKLKIGCVESNQFTIKLRNIDPQSFALIVPKIEKVKTQGFPNYFGSQRFGHGYNNIHQAQKWFMGKIKVKQRSKKSFYLSAVRAMLFNALLSKRIDLYGWNTLLSGEQMVLNGSRSFFHAEQIDDALIKRFEQGDIDPSLCLWGRGELSSSGIIKQLEKSLKDDFGAWCDGLENKGLQLDRRTIRMIPENLNYQQNHQEQSITISFSLKSGAYASSLLSEIFQLK